MADSISELDAILDETSAPLVAALGRLAAAALSDDPAARLQAREELEELIALNMASADLMGRRQMLQRIRAAGDRRDFAAEVSFVPKVPLGEAIADLIGREPVLAFGWREAQEAYRAGAFALARSTEERVTKRVQNILERALRSGMTRTEAVDAITESVRAANPADELGGGFTRAYADTVFRTNMASAYEAGRHQQAMNPAMRKTVSGWRYNAIPDPDVRDNHAAGDGFVAHMDDPVWNDHAPPLGYNCRCTLELVRTREMRRMGLSDKTGQKLRDVTPPVTFRADPGFVGGRPDRKHYATG